MTRSPIGQDTTYDLQEAAQYLRMSPATLRQKASQGLIRGAKPGKRWVFLEADLADYLRAHYIARGQAPLSGSNQEKSLWESTNAARSGGFGSPHPVADEYASLLKLPTSVKR